MHAANLLPSAGYALANEALEDAIYDSQAMRVFIGGDLAIESVPDATTLLRFRHLLEKHALTQRIFEEINAHLAEKGLFMREGSIVDATIVAAAPSTKNKAKQRDPEMKQTRKGKQYYFGMKAHIGVDAVTGLTHSVAATSANVTDVTMTSHLVRDDDTRVYGDAGYTGMWKHLDDEKVGSDSRCWDSAKRGTIKILKNLKGSPVKELLLKFERLRPASVPMSSTRSTLSRTSSATGRIAARCSYLLALDSHVLVGRCQVNTDGTSVC
jgi:transposase, IS5 family